MRRVPTLLAIAGLSLGTGAAIAATSVATVGTASGRLGTFLVGTNGHTLYVLSADKRNKSTCGGQCATNWPPLLTSGKPKVKGTAKSSALGTIKRGSSEQVTYDGHPLYYNIADTVRPLGPGRQGRRRNVDRDRHERFADHRHRQEAAAGSLLSIATAR
jgi:predicted lipoprotein with Yx(FWY)xxD motif